MILSISVKIPIFPQPSGDTCVYCIVELSLSFFYTIFEITSINRAIFPAKLTISVLKTIFKISHIYSLFVCQFSLTIKSVILESTFVWWTSIFQYSLYFFIVLKSSLEKWIRGFLNSSAMFLVIFEISTIAGETAFINSYSIRPTMFNIPFIWITVCVNKSTITMWNSLNECPLIIALIRIIIFSQPVRYMVLNIKSLTFHSPE